MSIPTTAPAIRTEPRQTPKGAVMSLSEPLRQQISELMAHDAIGADARDELGISETLNWGE